MRESLAESLVLVKLCWAVCGGAREVTARPTHTRSVSPEGRWRRGRGCGLHSAPPSHGSPRFPPGRWLQSQHTPEAPALTPKTKMYE